ncbi:hypothetical protein ACP70R_003255 [Stipagrostis hirtigluma subsp. patula]
MAPLTIRRTVEIPGFVVMNGILHTHRSAVPNFAGVFAGGGYDWCVRSVPGSGCYGESIVGIYLSLATRGVTVSASAEFALLDPAASLPPWKLLPTPQAELDGDDDNKRTIGIWVPNDELCEGTGPRYLARYSLLLECTITVFSETPPPPPTSATTAAGRAKVPDSDMMEQIAKLYATKDGADVTYSIRGQLFRAHKFILAMRSPVFKAELYGGTTMESSTSQPIEVQDVDPDVFQNLLFYIYTDDTWPSSGSQGDQEAMTCDLLVAAGRYGVERLKLLCEHELSKTLNVGNVAKMLSFAADQHCELLKDACIEFMATSDRMKEVVASQGYIQLRSTHPMIVIEAFEKSNLVRNV